ncbi:fam-a protein [Plasmodium vinckei petteri]|uniref:Fam-a protein n=1 Tax=Plasmodium vinckei petteri TaxID=138298 RepID=A0A6V7SN88_PLAVN|nr:fam-a protein [Plasmodium vinckei petteri]
MNKFYIQIVLFLLNIFAYANNETLATEPATGIATKTKSSIPYSTPEEIYEQNKDLLCTNPDEAKQAEELMNEAATHLEYHIKNGDYQIWGHIRPCDRTFCRKNHGDIIFQRINYKYRNLDNYNETINLLWDPAHANEFNNAFVKRKIVRVYNPNLVMIQQRYRRTDLDNEKYFYALAAKIDISEEKTIIVMVSVNINDGYPSEEEYKNALIENANLFKTNIDSEDDIRNGQLEKKVLNIGGYLIENRDWYTEFNYLEAIDGHISNHRILSISKALRKFFPSK